MIGNMTQLQRSKIAFLIIDSKKNQYSEKSGQLFNGKESVAQGNPLAIIAYVIGVLPIIWELGDAHPGVNYPGYADDAREGGSFGNILANFKDIQVRGPSGGYLQEPTKSILLLVPWNVTRPEEFFQGMGMLVVSGNGYLNGFIDDQDAETTWLDEKVQGW